MGVFLLFFLTTGYVSLGSMAAAVSFPFIVMWWLNETVTSMNVFAIAVPILVLVTHQKNIERLLKKTESRVYLFRRKQ